MPSPVLVNSRSPIPVEAQRMKVLDDRLAALQKQVSTGDRLTDPSDDPAGNNRAMQLARQDSRLEADQKAIDRTASQLSYAESAVISATDAIARARDIALAASNGTYSSEDRTAMAQEVAVLRQQLLDSANMRDESGRYLFAGSRNSSPAYGADADGIVQWQGMGQAAGAESAGLAGLQLPRGPDLFGDAASGAFAQLQTLENALRSNDPDELRAGIDSSIDGLRQSYDRLVNGRSAIGAKAARLDTESDRIASTRLTVADALAKVKGVDLTAAFTEIEALKLSLSASQASFTTIYEGSLFDRLG